MRAMVSDDGQKEYMAMRKAVLEVSESKLRAWTQRLGARQPVYGDAQWPSPDDCEFVATLCAHLQRAAPQYQLRPLLAQSQDPAQDMVFQPNVLPDAYALAMKQWAYRNVSPAAAAAAATVPNIFASTAPTSSALLGHFADMWLQLCVYHPLDLFATAGQWAGAGDGVALRADVHYFFVLLFQRLVETNKIRDSTARMRLQFLAALVPAAPIKLFVEPMEAYVELDSALRNLDYEIGLRLRHVAPANAMSPWARPLPPGQFTQCVPVLVMPCSAYQYYYVRFPYEMSAISELHDTDKVCAVVEAIEDRVRAQESARVAEQLMRTELASVQPQELSPLVF